MSKDKLIPKLRFPEFEEDGEWVEKKLGNLIDLLSGYAFQSQYFSVEGQKLITPKNFSKEGYATFNKENTKYTSEISEDKYWCKEGDLLLLITDLTPTCELLGKPVLLKKQDGEVLLNQRIIKVIPKEKILLEFLLQFFLTDTYLIRIKSTATGSTVRHSSNKIILDTNFLLPNTYKEQQKIASCLSSLDEVIAAHSQKLALLKDHKKGLMQNLFPQEGEKVPRYRFKEFEKDGEWDLKDFSKYIKLDRGSSPRPIQEYLTQDESGVNWIKIGDTKKAVNSVIYQVEEKITLKGAEKSRRVEKGELILANSMSFGKTYELAIEGCIYDGWFVLRKYEKHFNKPFLLQLLNSDFMQNQYKRLSAGGIVQNISSDIVYNSKLFHTTLKEQQKIASCLSSLDALITAQAEKIEQLKWHKKGLMQGLFPSAAS